MIKKEYSSFRDPAGFVFFKNGIPYRQINYEYKEHYDYFKKSGLYQELSHKGYIIPFMEVNQHGKEYYKIIQSEKIDFISYPYEWCFSQYKEAALLTLKIQKEALLKGMTLKDASAYNIQFQNNKPIHIDTLSFEKLSIQKPWTAYQQFCQHFLAPLALMAFVDPRLNNLMCNYIDGIPLDLAGCLLPKFKSWGVFVNIHLNNLFSNNYKDLKKPHLNIQNMSLQKHLILIDGLYHTIKNLKLKKKKTEWGEYYSNTNYDTQSFKIKEKIISDILLKFPPKSMLWDFGANNGYFTRIATRYNLKAIAFDIDRTAVEENYSFCQQSNLNFPLPLILDLTNPSPGIGWNNNERPALFKRSKPDIIMALALIHHLVISKNLSFDYVASCFSQLSENLIIEFISKKDSQVQKLLFNKEDIFTHYTEDNFEKDFLKYYSSYKKYHISGTERIIYFFQK